MKRTFTVLAAVVSLTASLASVGSSASGSERASAATPNVITPVTMNIGPGNTWTPDLRAAMDAAKNPPIYVSNLPGLDDLNDPDLSYLSTLVETANKQGYNTATCSYASPNWVNGATTGNGQWTGGPFLDAYVYGHDAALGLGFTSQTSTATAEVGMWLVAPHDWPTPSTLTVDYRWGAGAHLQADADLSLLAGTGASTATAAYTVDGELWANSMRASQHFFDASVEANGGHPSATADPHVRWDDKTNAVVPTLTTNLTPDMDVKSKLIGAMLDNATPSPFANASAGVDSMHQGDTYIIGSQHFTFTMPKPYVLTDCGGDGVILQ